MQLLRQYGMDKFAEMQLHLSDELTVDITNSEIADVSKGIYVWLAGGNIIRIGSSKNPLRSRIIGTSRWITMRLQRVTKVSNPDRVKKELKDAMRWKATLQSNNNIAEVWGRKGTVVRTSVGEINSYLAEENYLLEKHQPPLNNSHFR